MTTTNKAADRIVTRFDVRENEDGDEVRLFHKRTKLFGFGTDDIALEDWEEKLQAYIDAEPRTDAECEAYLSGEIDEDEELEDEERGDIIPRKYRERYGVEQNCGDDVAVVFTGYVTKPRATKKDIDGGLDRAALREVADANGLGAKLDDYEARELNGGLLRMNIGNILRGMVRRGERVVIGKKVWEEDTSNPKNPKAKAAARAKADEQKLKIEQEAAKSGK